MDSDDNTVLQTNSANKLYGERERESLLGELFCAFVDTHRLIASRGRQAAVIGTRFTTRGRRSDAGVRHAGAQQREKNGNRGERHL